MTGEIGPALVVVGMEPIRAGYPNQLRNDIGQKSKLLGTHQARADLGGQRHIGRYRSGMRLAHG